MARNKLEAGFNAAARKQEAENAPLPVDTPEPPDTRPPRTPAQQAQLEAEMKMGHETAIRGEKELQLLKERVAKQRAEALAQGKSSPDDLS